MIRAVALVIVALTLIGMPQAAISGCGTDNPGCVVPTAPAGTNTNQAASTAFVQNAFSINIGACTVNQIFGGPTSGPAAAPTCRALVANDIPSTLNATVLGNGSTATTQAVTDTSTKIATSAAIFAALPYVNLLQYGVDTTGVVDACATAVPNALAALPSAGGTLFLPAGDIRLSTTCLTATNKAFRLIGQGIGVTRLHCYSTTADCISVSDTLAVYASTFNDFSIYPEVANTAGAGIHVNYANSLLPGTGPITAGFYNLEIGYQNNATNYFTSGINCNSCVGAYLSNVTIKGKNATSGSGIGANNMLYGILETGHSITFTKVFFGVTFAQYGIFAAGDVQGNQEFACNMIGVNYGWYYTDGSFGDPTSTPQDPGPEITDCNTATYIGGFVSKGWSQTTLSTSTFYKRPDSTQNWIAVNFARGTYSAVNYGSNLNVFGTGSQIYGFHGVAPGGTAVGVTFDTISSGDVVQGNLFTGVDNVFDWNSSGGNSAHFIIGNQAPTNIGTGWAVNMGTTCNNPIYWQGNFPEVVGVTNTDAALPTGATPCILPGRTNNAVNSVQGQQTLFTANGGATNITGFNTPYYGQTITIVGNDGGLSTLVNSGTMLLKGGVNVTLANGNAVTLRWNGGAWRELARNF